MFDCFLTTAFFSICVVCVLLAAHVKSWFIGPGLSFLWGVHGEHFILGLMRSAVLLFAW